MEAYNPFQNNIYNIFESAPTPKVELNLPLLDSPIDISDWSIGISPYGMPIVKPYGITDSSADEEYTESARTSRMIEDIEKNNFPEIYESSHSNDSAKEDSKQESKQYKLSTQLTSRQKQAMEFFMNKGLTNFQAAGIVGNLMHESGDPSLGATETKGDGGRSVGLGQWNGSRRKNLNEFAKSKGKKSSDFITQLEFIWEEMTNPDFKETGYRVLERLKACTNVRDAANVFMNYYERPGIPAFNKRLKFSQLLLK